MLYFYILAHSEMRVRGDETGARAMAYGLIAAAFAAETTRSGPPDEPAGATSLACRLQSAAGSLGFLKVGTRPCRQMRFRMADQLGCRLGSAVLSECGQTAD